MKTVANSPEEKVREIVDACADCDCCRRPAIRESRKSEVRTSSSWSRFPEFGWNRSRASFIVAEWPGSWDSKGISTTPPCKWGERLIKKIEERKPELVATDCLSCRLQFRQTMAYEVRHPVEIIAESCGFLDTS